MALLDLLWRAEYRLNRRFSFAEPVPWTGQFVPRGLSWDVLGMPPLSANQAPDLCVVITTYARPDACLAQIRALRLSLVEADCADRAFILVLVDFSDSDYAPVLAELSRLFAGRFALYEATERIGKQGFFRAYQCAFDAVKALQAPFTLFLQDDLTFERSFVRNAFARWAEIQDDAKAVLYLCVMPDDEPEGRWIKHAREDNVGKRIRRTQWFDLPAFLAHQSFFEHLRFQVFPVPASRWSKNRSRSSGVGEQFTRRLFGRANVYQVSETLVYHGDLPSLMNPEARAERPLDNRQMLQRIAATSAWLPSDND